MNGEDLLRGMSHVEERFIEEAQETPAVRKTPWVRIGAMAACFAFALVCGGFWLSGADLALKGNDESSAIVDRAEIEEIGSPETVADIAYEGSVDAVPKETASVLVRINTWQENGFTATVESIIDTEIFPVGTAVTVKFRDNIRILETDGEIVSCTLRTPTEEDFPADSVVQVMFSLGDGGVIYAESIGDEAAF